MDIYQPMNPQEAKKAFQKMNRQIIDDNVNAFVCLKDINKIYPNGVHAVYNFNIDINKNEFIVLVGPSGCGKSTVLRMIAGLEEITSGYLYIDKTLANSQPSKDRNIAMVFQSYALYPHMNVFDNMSFSLRINKARLPKLNKNGEQVYGIDTKEIRKIKRELKKNPEDQDLIAKLHDYENNLKPLYVKRNYTKDELNKIVFDAAEILNLGEYLDRKPKELSGGQMQRVALGRAIVRNPKLFLMDEPLSNLDAKLRVSMRSELVRIHNDVKATTIYVTHDQVEAMTMADRIVVMNKGWIQQIATPQELYESPSNIFVATFIGSPAMNLIEGTYNKGSITFKNGDILKLTKDEKKSYEKFIEESLTYYHSLQKLIEKSHIELLEQIDSITSLLDENGFNDEVQMFFKSVLNLVFSDEKQPRFAKIIPEINLVLEKKSKLLAQKNLKKLQELILEEETEVSKAIEKINSNKYSSITANKAPVSKKKNKQIVKRNLLDDKKIIDEYIAQYQSSKDGNHRIFVGIRPEYFNLDNSQDNFILEIKGQVEQEYLGTETLLHFDYCGTEIIAKLPSKTFTSRQNLRLTVSNDKMFIFDAISGLRI